MIWGTVHLLTNIALSKQKSARNGDGIALHVRYESIKEELKADFTSWFGGRSIVRLVVRTVGRGMESNKWGCWISLLLSIHAQSTLACQSHLHSSSAPRKSLIRCSRRSVHGLSFIKDSQNSKHNRNHRIKSDLHDTSGCRLWDVLEMHGLAFD